MLKSAILTFIGGILFVASLPLSATIVGAHNVGQYRYGYGWSNDCRAESVPEATQRIWQSLWDGVNLDFNSNNRYGYETAATDTSCQTDTYDRTTTTGTPYTYNTPDTTVITPTTPAPTPTTTPTPAPAPYPASGYGGYYVAMGDSVAAGLGLPLLANDTSRDRSCGRSGLAYPYYVAKARQLQLINVTCSGATTGDLITPQGINRAPNPSRQIAAVFADGVPLPELITVTVGANDVQWAHYISKCYRSVCGNDRDTAIVSGSMALVRARLVAFFSELQIRSNGRPPTTVITGYYNPLSSACSDLTPRGTATTDTPRLTTYELAWLQANANALNRTIRDVAAQYNYVRFAPVDFSGHDICSNQPWVQGLNGRAPLHPTAEGQRAIAEAVLRAI